MIAPIDIEKDDIISMMNGEILRVERNGEIIYDNSSIDVDIPDYVICPNCETLYQNRISEQYIFCGNCGVPLKKASVILANEP